MMITTGSEPSGNDLISTLSSTQSIFSALSHDELRLLEPELELITLRGGEVLIAQGEPGDSMYVLLSGRLLASQVLEDRTEQPLGEIGRGESVGEMALLTGGVRSATVRAVRDSLLIKFSKEAFDRTLAMNPKASLMLARMLVQRLEQQSSSKPKQTVSTIAVVAPRALSSMVEFSRRLASALSAIGPAFHVNREILESQLGEKIWESQDTAALPAVNNFLDELEAQHKFVVYQADTFPSEWTRRCIRQADRLLFLVDANSEPAVPAFVAEYRQLLTRRDLILLHQQAGRAGARVKEWCEALGVTNHYHVALGSSADYERLARFLTGRATGVALGGGGARGFAHLGALRAIREAGIPIDMICGTSMGSIIAAQHAIGLDDQRLIEINRKAWIEMDPLRDKTLPLVSLVAGRRLERMLTVMFGETRIEDLWTNYFCVSSNLTQAKVIVHNSGLLKAAIRCSVAIPGVAAPVCQNGDLIVDGGVLNNLPGDLMRKFCGGTVIAIDVSPQTDLAVDEGYAQMPSAADIIWSRINPMRKSLRVPNIFAIIARTAMLSSIYQTNAVMKEVDLYIRPDLDGFGIFEWNALPAIVEAGYRSTVPKIERWLARQANPTETNATSQ